MTINAALQVLGVPTEHTGFLAAGNLYQSSAVHFDGSAWLTIQSLIATLPRKFSMSMWVKLASLADNNFAPLVVADPDTLYDPLVELETGAGTDNEFSYSSTVGASALKGFSAVDTLTAGSWLNLKISADSDHNTPSKVVQLYLGDTSVVDSIVDNDVAFDMVFNGLKVIFGGDGVGSSLVADVADAWIAPGQLIDWSSVTNRRKFIDAVGKPMYLGADGSRPTGVAPRIFFSGNAASFSTNRGTGGAAVLTGTLTNAATAP